MTITQIENVRFEFLSSGELDEKEQHSEKTLAQSFENDEE